jgi:hypothetical protein
MAYFVHGRCNEDWAKSDGNGQRVEDLEHGVRITWGRERRGLEHTILDTIVIRDGAWGQVSVIDNAEGQA